MPPVSQSREVLTTMDSGQANLPTLSFGRKNGCFLSRNVAVMLGLLFLVSLLATGLIVYYYATPIRAGVALHSKTSTLETPVEASSTGDVLTAGIIGNPPPSLPMTTTSMETTMMTTPRMPASSTMAPKKEKVMDVRLPRSIKPIKYLIRLQPFINGNFSIMGYTEITIEVLESTKNLSIHIADIITRNQTIKLNPTDDLTGPGVSIMQHKYDADREFYVAMLEQELMAGKQYVLTMEFEGLLNDRLRGFYRSQYTDQQGNTKMLATTQFQPTDARRAFPCFDEPALKAEFEVFLARETNMSAISNMPKIDTMPVKAQPGWVWEHFNTTEPIPTYLVSFVISNLKNINTTTDESVQLRVWAQNKTIEQANYSIGIMPDLMTYFQDYFNLPYPLLKMDMVALPSSGQDSVGSRGLATNRETALLYDIDVSTSSNKQRVATAVSHELAHQWLGNLMTSSLWTDLWLNEGIAAYLGNLAVDAIEPTWKILDQFLVNHQHKAFQDDGLETSVPLSLPEHNPEGFIANFDTITRNKGASLIRMMSHFLGEGTLRKGISNFIKHYQHNGGAKQDHLWRFLTKQAHRDDKLPSNLTVKTIMDTWTQQKGYPVVTVNFKEQGMAQIAQERFVISESEASTDRYDYKWWIPITLTNQVYPIFNNTSPSMWLPATQTPTRVRGLPPSTTWTIVNIHQAGFYRVNYDVKNWMMIVKQLRKDHKIINVSNRAQLLDDSLNLARAGMLSYNVAMHIFRYLYRENEYIPWKSGFDNIEYLMGMLSRTEAYRPFKRYLLALSYPYYKKVGFSDASTDSHLDQLKRAMVRHWACRMDSRDCVKNAKALFSEWMKNSTNSSIIAPTLKEAVFSNAIRRGGQQQWNFAWEQYKKSNVSTEKESLVKALGCTREPWILLKYLDMAFSSDSGVNKQDAKTAFEAVARNEVGRDLAWNFLRARLPDVVRYFGGSADSTLASMIKSVSMTFNSRLMREDLIMFKGQYSNILKPISRGIDQSIERTANNEAWFSTHYPVIVKWLKDNGYYKF